MLQGAAAAPSCDCHGVQEQSVPSGHDCQWEAMAQARADAEGDLKIPAGPCAICRMIC